MQRRAAFLFVLCSILATVVAQAQMDATMKRDETRTLVAQLSYSAQTFMVNEPIKAVITASPELSLGHTTIQGFNCTETPNVNTCNGTVPAAGTQTVTISQVLTVRDEASRSSGSWTVQLVGDGLSGALPKTGVITIPDPQPKVVVIFRPYGFLSPPGMSHKSSANGLVLQNFGDAPGSIRLVIDDPASPFKIDDSNDVTALFAVGQVRTFSISYDARPVGIYKANIQMTGVVESTNPVPLELRVEAPPTATPKPDPATNRVDIPSSSGASNPTAA